MKQLITDSLATAMPHVNTAGKGVAGIAGIEGVNDLQSGSPLLDSILKVVILVVTVGRPLESIVRSVIGIFRKKK